MYKLVIVDDEPHILEGLQNLYPWDNLGFHVVATFVNGKEALDYINTHDHIDAVMTDIQMPIMSGIELAKNLKDSDTIVIFFSAYQDFEYARAAIINHVVDYLVKPMNYSSMTQCFERVRKILDKIHAKNASNVENTSDNNDNSFVASVKNYINENYRTATLEDAAVLLHYSAAYLSSTFREESGISFSKYLTQVRLEHAMEMLKDRHIRLYEISDAVGYVNPKNLTRNFKEYYGITPQEFRAGKTPVITESSDES